MEKINQSELIAKVAAATGHTKKTIKSILRNLVTQVNGHVGAGCAVTIKDLGIFKPAERKPRKIKSAIVQGRITDVPHKRVVTFHRCRKSDVLLGQE